MSLSMIARNLIKQPKGIRFNHSWVVPKGFETEIKIYNCITKQKEPLILKTKNVVTWYTCGPTVYDSSHLGHASCYVKLDIIQRILRNYFKFNLITTVNITDIDDKIIRRANELNIEYSSLAKKFEKEFWDDWRALGIEKPSVILRVTENMPSIIKFIEKIIQNDQAYVASDNSVYFNVKTMKEYGKLQNIGVQEEKPKPGHIKKSVLDFALWKNAKEGEPFWESPWGNGRPGWHIECSALASNVYGSNIDIHAGGIDLRFPHHENEEAQSCAFHHTPQWVNYWIHTGYLHLSHNEKMSKSLKNTISIQDMLKKTTSDNFRMACIMSSYQSNMEYSEELMNMAEHTYKTFKNFLVSCDEFKNGYIKSNINTDILNELIVKSAEDIHKALCDNFNTPVVIKTLHELVSTTNSMFHTSTSLNNSHCVPCVLAIRNIVSNTLEILGLNIHSKSDFHTDINELMDILNLFRQDVRNLGIQEKNKNLLNLCDSVRDNVKKCGITIKDHGKLSSWSR